MGHFKNRNQTAVNLERTFMKKSSTLLLLSFLFASSAQAEILTFDDIPGGSIHGWAGGNMPTYKGFNFSDKFVWIDLASSWRYGARSGDFALANNNGGAGMITSANSSDFSFDGLWAKKWATPPESGGLASFFDTIQGFNNGVEVWSIDIALNGSYQFIAGQSQRIDELKLGRDYFLVDDLALNQPSISVPEPSTLLLLSLGFLGLGLAKSRRSV